ncbi:MAG: TIGR02757 family protein [Deltaproteobacteria bacterium RBG_13_49_15]|nr:MAG: TIGR02757 family protein [Deltaproteobacteria bacterium RBG_13_49_15]
MANENRFYICRVNEATLKKKLDRLYFRYNRRAFVHPDPLEFLYLYDNPLDREIVGLLASSLAYGRVSQILKSVSWVIGRLGPSPSGFVKQAGQGEISDTFDGFVHRFATDNHLGSFFSAIKKIIGEYGSLYQCFLAGMNKKDRTIRTALSHFSANIIAASDFKTGHLIPLPDRGSSCKRLNLFLRWMVREDAVDPGGWSEIPASKLIVPLDTHMHAISLQLGLTCRKQPDLKTAMEITDRFRMLSPRDPVKYDFVLTRFGIRSDLHLSDLFLFCNGKID